MRHALFLKGLNSFFQAPTHRLPRYALHIAQFLSLVLKQLQRPVGITLWKVAARYGYKVRSGTFVQFAFPSGTRSIDQRDLRPLLPEALTCPDYCSLAYRRRFGYSVFNPAFVGPDVRLCWSSYTSLARRDAAL